ncbi:hypothetical protein P7C71_g2201, partial [Lecanoromycetidae sp. Uapishka_2]
MASSNQASSSDMPIQIKIVFANKDENRRFNLPLRDLGAETLPNKLRSLLNIPSSQSTVFERYSDSSASYIKLDSNNPSVYKQLTRAAKAKSKLKIKVTVTDKNPSKSVEMPKPPTALPERLSARSYVHPYISDPSKLDNDSSSHQTIPTSEQLRNSASAATLVPPPFKASSETLREKAQDNVFTASPPYFWPISHNGSFSEAAKAVFEKKDVPATPAKENNVDENTGEAPVPRFFSDREGFLAQHANISQKLDMIRNARGRNFSIPGTSFTICCNNCDKSISDAHWHCGICDHGDFDVCGDCVENGKLCEGQDHFLIKRFVKDGKVIASTTETIAPKKATKIEEKVPGAFTSELKREEARELPDLSRTCNSCVQVFEESNFVTCTVCEDYDLCIPCHVNLKHGHHPSHTLEPASKEAKLGKLATILCAPGRNMRHGAICDRCDNDIYGVRHKCLNCPDYDYCSTCVKDAAVTHPGHRMVPLYEYVQARSMPAQRHTGIYCDGPRCANKGSYISGDRYKCAVCHDTDFCADCEALPELDHNRTHPLIKFKTPVRNVSVTTMGEKPNGEQMRTMGDQMPQTSSKSTETTPAAPSANAATQVQTVAEVKPTEAVKEEPKVESPKPVSTELQAHFICDTIIDGSTMPCNTQFEQSWTLRNPGPHAWPKGCCVCFIGGDSMLDVDSNHPSHVTQMHKATKTNVIERVVEVGEEVDFKVVLKTPEREGQAISYWRLKDATGMPFGHKLWCDVKVVSVHDEELPRAVHIEDISKHAKVEDEIKEEQSESTMIFPKLDKESPVSGTHEAEIPAPAAPAAMTADEKVLLEDVESLELDDESDSDEPFLTDEEYELIVSDDEMESAKNGKK